MDDAGFWTLGRISVGLQVMLVALVVGVLAITMNTLVSQTAEFGRQAEARAVEAEQAVLRAQESIRQLTCILLISPDERTAEIVVAQCGVQP